MTWTGHRHFGIFELIWKVWEYRNQIKSHLIIFKECFLCHVCMQKMKSIFTLHTDTHTCKLCTLVLTNIGDMFTCIFELSAATVTAQSTFAFLSSPQLSSLQNGGQPSNTIYFCQYSHILLSVLFVCVFNLLFSSVMGQWYTSASTTNLPLLFPKRFLFLVVFCFVWTIFGNVRLFVQTSWYKHNHRLLVKIKKN